MTISLIAASKTNVLAFHNTDAEGEVTVTLNVGGNVAILAKEQREALAAYLLKENN